jgi:hypothetical protein
MDRKTVKFLRKYRMFNTGETAGFRGDVADMLVDMKVAKYVGANVVTEAVKRLKDLKKDRAMKAGKAVRK